MTDWTETEESELFHVNAEVFVRATLREESDLRAAVEEALSLSHEILPQTIDDVIAIVREHDAPLIEARAVAAESHAERLAAALALVLYDAHPTYGSTALWHGGIGGQAITTHCSIAHGAHPGGEWAECDLPSKPLREWLQDRQERGLNFDLDAAKESMKAELLLMLRGGGENA